METLFNFAWALLGTLILGAGWWLRRRFAPDARAGVVRDLILLSLIVFLLFPIVSFSDDVGYFSYYFSHRQAPESLFFVSGSRREEQLPSLVFLQVFAVLLAALVSAFRQRTVFGLVPVAESARAITRKAAPVCLRAPPSSLF